MAGQSKPIYRAGTLNMKSYKATYELFERMEVAEKSTKAETLLKIHLGQTPTVPVMAGKEREENMPRLPTPRRSALASSRQEMQAIQENGRPGGKHDCCMNPGTPRKSVKY